MSRPVGTAAELERRRRRAIQLLRQGESPTDIARILGVARPSLYRWQQLADRAPAGLAAKPHPGPTPRLSDDQLHELEGLLEQGAKAHGWPNQLWTAARVAQLIRRHFDVSFHPDHVRRYLFSGSVPCFPRENRGSVACGSRFLSDFGQHHPIFLEENR
jgi:transposase